MDTDFPWAALLSEPDRTAFVDELDHAMDAAAALKSDAQVVQLVQEWRATAEIHADPRLASRLRTAITTDGDRVVPPQG